MATEYGHKQAVVSNGGDGSGKEDNLQHGDCNKRHDHDAHDVAKRHGSERPSTSKSGHDEKEEEQRPTIKEFAQSFSKYRLIDPNEPWILVEEGSFLRYFDWVPRPLRVGPWSVAAVCYLFAFSYLFTMGLVYFGEQHWWRAAAAANQSMNTLEYPTVRSHQWTYNVLAFVWMMYITYLILQGPLTYFAWATYTVQSWTLLWVRHGLCILAPLFAWAGRWAEYIRFPVACSATVTFVVWNLVLMPTIYFIGLRSQEEKKKAFLKFCFSFRLVQLHGFNIVYCLLNVWWSSPPRTLQPLDFLAAIGSALFYIGWYLCFMDRVGIHFYPVFSPRVGWLVVTAWTALLVGYVAIFTVWQHVLQPTATTTQVNYAQGMATPQLENLHYYNILKR